VSVGGVDGAIGIGHPAGTNARGLEQAPMMQVRECPFAPLDFLKERGTELQPPRLQVGGELLSA
jgi:hypothetical protein